MNTYKAFYKGRQLELKAETSLRAQKIANITFKAKKRYEITIVLVAKGDEPVKFDPSQI